MTECLNRQLITVHTCIRMLIATVLFVYFCCFPLYRFIFAIRNFAKEQQDLVFPLRANGSNAYHCRQTVMHVHSEP